METYDELPTIVPSHFIAAMNALEMIDLSECRQNPERVDVPIETR